MTRRFFTPILYASLFATPFLFDACSAADRNGDEDLVVTIDPEFGIDLYQQRAESDGAATLGLWLESTEPYECAGYRPDVRVETTSDKISVNLLEMIRPDSCSGGPANAQAFIPLGQVDDGIYTLSFTLGGLIVNEGVLTAYNGVYEWSLPTASGIDLQNRVLRNIPEGVVWGYVRTPGEQDAAPANAFVSALKDVSSDPALTPGYYGYFTVAGTGLPYFHKSFKDNGPAVYFVRKVDGNPALLRGLLQGFRDQSGLEVRCMSTYGAL